MDIRIPEFDLLTAGFPCQPFSVAGKQRGENDSRNKWPSTISAIRLLQPRYALLENVPGILSVGRPAYFGRILGDLAESGYNAQWDCISASAVGAPHRRNRVWIYAYPNRDSARFNRKAIPVFGWGSFQEGSDTRWVRNEISDADIKGLSKRDEQRSVKTKTTRIFTGSESLRAHTENRGKQWEVEPSMGRVADGVQSRVDRIKCLGNAVVPQVVTHVGRCIKDAIEEGII